MRYYKIIDGEYLKAIGTGNGGIEITEAEYGEISSVIQNRPAPESGYAFRLKTNLTYERYELPAEEDDPELTAEEALEIIVGGTA